MSGMSSDDDDNVMQEVITIEKFEKLCPECGLIEKIYSIFSLKKDKYAPSLHLFNSKQKQEDKREVMQPPRAGKKKESDPDLIIAGIVMDARIRALILTLLFTYALALPTLPSSAVNSNSVLYALLDSAYDTEFSSSKNCVELI